MAHPSSSRPSLRSASGRFASNKPPPGRGASTSTTRATEKATATATAAAGAQPHPQAPSAGRRETLRNDRLAGATAASAAASTTTITTASAGANSRPSTRANPETSRPAATSKKKSNNHALAIHHLPFPPSKQAISSATLAKKTRKAFSINESTRAARPIKLAAVTQTATQNGLTSLVPNGIGIGLQSHTAAHRRPDATTNPSAPKIQATKGISNKVRTNNDAKPREETRTLRSKDGGSRIKSELAIYFSNYDEIIRDAPKSPEFLKPNELIYIVDEPLKASPSKNASTSTLPIMPKTPGKVKSPPRKKPLPFDTIDLASLTSKSDSSPPTNDPLSDEAYLKAHRRAERKEKQLRNIEKERAQHEKVQLEFLLEHLHGPEWLRVMGVTGVTDGARKEWEPKRDYFIREVRALLEKFKVWKEAEKRLLLEKDSALIATKEEKESEEEEEEEEEEGDDDEEEEEEEAEEEAEEEEEPEATTEDEEASDSSADGPNSSDLDAEAARQLLQEAKSASKPKSRPKLQLPIPKAPVLPVPPAPPSPKGPFLSFYSKPHLRAAALGKARHGRTVIAFGHPLPDFPLSDFSLPDEYVTPESLTANARKRRRLNRERNDAVKA